MSIHEWFDNENCNSINCKKNYKVLKIRYVGLIFDNNLKRNLYVNNLLGKLRFITYNTFKPKKIVPNQTMRLVYFALYQSNFQYGYQYGVGH